MMLFHGTSSIFPMECGAQLLPPMFTGVLREDFRRKDLDKVFATNSLVSAEMYARKACKKYGGDPVVYVVRPIGDVLQNNSEFLMDSAEIIERRIA